MIGRLLKMNWSWYRERTSTFCTLHPHPTDWVYLAPNLDHLCTMLRIRSQEA
jgi:hypothetical protein